MLTGEEETRMKSTYFLERIFFDSSTMPSTCFSSSTRSRLPEKINAGSNLSFQNKVLGLIEMDAQ